MTAGTPAPIRASRIASPRLVLADQHRDVRRSERSSVSRIAGVEPESRTGGQQRRDVGDDVGLDGVADLGDTGGLAGLRDAAPPGAGAARRRPSPSSRRCGCALRTSRTTIRGSPSAAPHASAAGARRPAPASLRQLVSSVAPCVGLLHRAQIAEHVRAAERVDRLLRVADQDQRHVPVERSPQDVPLDRVGVLELVDEHDAEALPEPFARRARRAPDRPGRRGAWSACRRS